MHEPNLEYQTLKFIWRAQKFPVEEGKRFPNFSQEPAGCSLNWIR